MMVTKWLKTSRITSCNLSSWVIWRCEINHICCDKSVCLYWGLATYTCSRHLQMKWQVPWLVIMYSCSHAWSNFSSLSVRQVIILSLSSYLTAQFLVLHYKENQGSSHMFNCPPLLCCSWVWLCCSLLGVAMLLLGVAKSRIKQAVIPCLCIC